MAAFPVIGNRTAYSVLSTQYCRAVAGTLVISLAAFTSLARADSAASAFLGRTPGEWLARSGSQKPHERAEAAWALAQLVEPILQVQPETALLSWLASGTADEDPTVRYWSIQGLQRLALSTKIRESSRQSVKGTLRTMLSDKALSPRIAAAETLGLLGEADRALPVLVEAMSDPQDAVRIQAVAALEKLGEAARPAESTLRAATSDSSEYVKRISTRALQKLDAAKR